MIAILAVVAALIILVLLVWKLWFLRNPERVIPCGRHLLSPADGRVLKIIPINDCGLDPFAGDTRNTGSDFRGGWQITIFLSLFDVHFQRAPVDGKVEIIQYFQGRFFPAFTRRAGANERNRILLNNPELGRIEVIQAAGYLARRIKCFVREKESVKKGQVIGLITFGSRVSLLVPGFKLRIGEGQRVKAGQTVIAEY